MNGCIIDQLGFPYFLFSMIYFIFVFDSFTYIYKYMTWCDYICALLPSAFLSLWPLSSSSLVPMSLWLKVCLPLLELPLNQQLFGKGWSPVDTFSITYGALRVPSLVQVSIYAVCSWWPWPCHSWVTAFWPLLALTFSFFLPLLPWYSLSLGGWQK